MDLHTRSQALSSLTDLIRFYHESAIFSWVLHRVEALLGQIQEGGPWQRILHRTLHGQIPDGGPWQKILHRIEALRGESKMVGRDKSECMIPWLVTDVRTSIGETDSVVN